MRELLRRRVPQIVGAYLAASWILLEFTSWAVNQYALSPALSNFVVTALLLLLPAVVVLAWRHGALGQDRWTTTDGVVIGLNVVAAAGVLGLLFGGQELGAATTVRLLEDDDGNTVERVLPKAGFRRDLIVWDFDNESGDPELDWLRTGLWIGLLQDLSQDLFVTPFDVDDPQIREVLAHAGFELPYGIPLALKRQLAEARGIAYFLEGEVLERDKDTLVVLTRLYETRNARELAARTYRDTDPLEIVDRVSVDVRRDLGIPDWQIEDSIDLPAAEMLTDSPEALRALSGYRAPAFQNRLAEARAAAEQATEIDSAFASAHATAASHALLMGDHAAAQEGIAEALRYSYRLPERTRLLLQMLDRLIFRIDQTGALQTGRYWTEVYPQDRMARGLLAGAYGIQGKVDEQIGQYRALLSMDSTNTEGLQGIARAFRVRQDHDSALAYYHRLADLRPTDTQTRLDIAATQSSLLQFDEARAGLERARVVAPEDPNVLGRLARLDMREGRHEDAARRIEEMSALARTAQHGDLVAGTEATLYYSLGRYGPLREAHDRRREAMLEYLPPVSAVMSLITSEALTYAPEWNREADALEEIERLSSLVEEPWSLSMAVPAVQVHLERGDVPAAQESLARLRTFSESFSDARVRSRITWVEARIAELEDEDCERALRGYEAARDLLPESAEYRAWLAICLTSLDRWNEAEGEVVWLLEHYPGSAMVRLISGRHYAARGRKADAIAQLEVALGIWSEADEDYRPAEKARALLEEF